MSADSMYVLVEMKGITVKASNSNSGFMGGTSSCFQTHAGGGGGGGPVPCEIHRVIRTYESRERADEDMELLRVVAPVATYRILDVPHIER